MEPKSYVTNLQHLLDADGSLSTTVSRPAFLFAERLCRVVEIGFDRRARLDTSSDQNLY